MVPVCEHELRRSAFHEVCHLLLADLAAEAVCREDIQTAIEHAIVRRLENFVFEEQRTSVRPASKKR
jgi:hypothetical protein